MIRTCRGLLIVALAVAAAPFVARTASRPSPAAAARTSFVNPFIGTGGHGHTYPGPSLPFGMIQPGPDTRLTGWDSSSGYHDSDTHIAGFSHTHLSGTGIPDYGDVLIMPTTAEVHGLAGRDGLPEYASSFSHAEEDAHPGYYAVTLRDSGIRAELTTTLRVGLHRYTLPAGKPVHVVLDLNHRDTLIGASVEPVGDREVIGQRRSSSWAKDQQLFYVIRFSRPFASNAIDARSRVGVFDFAASTSGEPLLVKVGMSAVSVDGARRNVDAELPGWDFDAVRSAADAAWEKELGRIELGGPEGGPDLRKPDLSGPAITAITFYTALYHAMLTPNVYMDVDGQYRGRDGAVHHADGFTYYSVFSLWDTFRALHPLLTIIDRARTADFVKTMLQQYKDGGRLPVWELAGNETDTMIGYHAVPVIAEAILLGVPGLDAPLALEAMIHSADEDRNGLDSYRRRGYVDAADASESVSRTLEYAYDDWCIAKVAERLNRRDVAERFFRRAQSWRNVFDPATGFMRPRVEGQWLAPFDPREVNSHYTEANAWQYSFFVPQDIDSLIDAHGGPAKFAQKLDALFGAVTQTTGRDQADITGLVGQYAHGNEPSHHVAYLYDFAGQAWKTQAMVRRLVDTMYAAKPDGLAGNDDCGQMSAWLVLSAIGFYPVTPASGEYAIGSPSFPKVTLHLESGRSFSIETLHPEAPYIQSASLNGAPYTRAYVTWDTISSGGTLAFAMDAMPNREWGAPEIDRPHTVVTGAPIVPAPFVTGAESVFRGRTIARLGDAEKGVEIRYTLDGSAPGLASPIAREALTLTETTTVRAIARRATGEMSQPMTATFHKIPDGRRITLSATYANQYRAGGPDALIDTLRGSTDFRRGRWQGYLGTDLTAVVDLGVVQNIGRVAMGFLQDTGSWILLPKRMRVEASIDGRSFVDIGAATHDLPAREMMATIRELGVTPVSPVRARYVRVTIEHFGRLPDWHPGKGEESWFFADEIVIDTVR